MWADPHRGGLIHAPTGTGKTLAAFGAAAIRGAGPPGAGRGRKAAPPIALLWVTPLRALAADTAKALSDGVAALGLPWTVEARTSDTSSAAKQRQKERLPTVLVTTPESVCVLLSFPHAAELLATLRTVVVDEWHELLGSKRGVQAELALARLRALCPGLVTWGLSATIGNLDEAARALVGVRGEARVTSARLDKEIVVETLIPTEMERFPWSGHLGTRQVGPLCERIGDRGSALVFTNTRSQAELWFRGILDQRPDWAGEIGLHHGSLESGPRRFVEEGLKSGSMRVVVCTSSLDLGVDFPAVDLVAQIGSPKGLAKLLQRAGRSGHRPGAPSRIVCVPTHALELVDLAAVRVGLAAGRVEPRTPPRAPLDVLVQHLVTVASGGGFDEATLRDEVRDTAAYAGLTDADWRWAMDFVENGGVLSAYPEYRRVVRRDGRVVVADDALARRHRLGIGTIVADPAVPVKLGNGQVLGTVEESFVARLAPGARFVFAGRTLVFVRYAELAAWARVAPAGARGQPVRWAGNRMPLSTELAGAIRDRLDEAARGVTLNEEMAAVAPLIAAQAARSRVPRHGELLIETYADADGWHVFVYPFEGRAVHEGLGALLAVRLARANPTTMTVAYNDYGVEILCADPPDLAATLPTWFSPDNVVADALESLDAGALAKIAFRGIARVAGLVVQGPPEQRKSLRQIDASTNLFWEVFKKYDPDNLLLVQARREVLERQLEHDRLVDTLARLAAARPVVVALGAPSPLCFPLLAGMLRDRVDAETFDAKIRKLLAFAEGA